MTQKNGGIYEKGKKKLLSQLNPFFKGLQGKKILFNSGMKC